MGRGFGGDRGERSELADRVVRVNRVAKVVKGGRKFSFSALSVVGDLNGRVGAGIGKAREVTEAIRKGMEVAKRNMITVPMVGTTIPHEVNLKWGPARIMLKPAAPGTGDLRWRDARGDRDRRYQGHPHQVARDQQPDQHRARDPGRAPAAADRAAG